MFVEPPSKTIYCYSILQPFMTQLAQDDPSVQLHHGFDPKLYENRNPSTHIMICIDDLMSDENIYRHLSDLFCKFARHLRVSTIFICQNLYFRGSSSSQKFGRDVLTNATELVLYRNLRDTQSAVNVAKQAFPSNFRYFMSVFRDATRNPHSYLFLSFHPSNRDFLVLRTNIFYQTETPIIYLEAK